MEDFHWLWNAFERRQAEWNFVLNRGVLYTWLFYAPSVVFIFLYNSKENYCNALLSFVGWTVTSFLCHLLAKVFLRTAISGNYIHLVNGFVWAAIITLAQMTMCYLLTDLRLSETRKTRAQSILVVKIVCHILATLATNYSMTLVHASSTFAIKLLEPVTSAIVQHFVLGISLSPSALASLPFAICGAMIFCGSLSLSANGMVMAFLSNIVLAFRNVAIKLEQDDASLQSVQLRKSSRMIIVLMPMTLLVAVLEYLTFQKLLMTPVAFLTLTATSSSLFHVMYSYISTNIVLLYMTVVSHSVANIFKRVLVVLLLYSAGQREANMFNFSGLAVCVFGLLLYTRSKMSTNSNLNITGMFGGNQSRPLIIWTLFACVTMSSVGLYAATLKYIHPKNKLNMQLPASNNLTVYIPSPKSCHDNESIKNVSEKLRLLLPPLTNGCTANSRVQYIPEMFPPLLSSSVPLSIQTIENIITTFLQRKLITTPQETDVLSPLLTTTTDAINETQRVHMNLFSDLIGTFKYAVLFDVATYENKGDPAISAGETYLILRLGLKLLYYCNLHACTMENLKKVKAMLAAYPVKDVVVLMQGGGNLVGYETNDHIRARVFQLFGQYQSVLFPQSILIRPNKAAENHLEFCKKVYKKQANLTMILRDRQSLWYAKQHFSGGPRLFLAPDMAFEIGHVPRFISPVFDILWIKRKDDESPNFKVPSLPAGITVHVADWWGWKTPKGKTSMETAFLMTNNGLIFLQRGRVVITDRLHGHILSTLLDIPHVLIDNPYRKLSMFHNSWTRSVENTVLVNTAEDAIKEAVKLLHKYGKQLPQIIPYMDLDENLSKP